MRLVEYFGTTARTNGEQQVWWQVLGVWPYQLPLNICNTYWVVVIKSSIHIAAAISLAFVDLEVRGCSRRRTGTVQASEQVPSDRDAELTLPKCLARGQACQPARTCILLVLMRLLHVSTKSPPQLLLREHTQVALLIWPIVIGQDNRLLTCVPR
jgi:hypothetical protein